MAAAPPPEVARTDARATPTASRTEAVSHARLGRAVLGADGPLGQPAAPAVVADHPPAAGEGFVKGPDLRRLPVVVEMAHPCRNYHQGFGPRADHLVGDVHLALGDPPGAVHCHRGQDSRSGLAQQPKPVTVLQVVHPARVETKTVAPAQVLALAL